MDQNYGSWMRDAGAKDESSSEKIWATRENDGFQLFEYASRATYKNNVPSKVYRMQFPFKVIQLIHLLLKREQVRGERK